MRAGKPVLLTDGLAQQLTNKVHLEAPNVHILPVKGDPKSLLQLAQRELDELRAPLLRPFQAIFKAPNQVALYLFRDGSWVVENFTDETASVELDGQLLKVGTRGSVHRWKQPHFQLILPQVEICHCRVAGLCGYCAPPGSERSSAWLERVVWVHEVAGSNPVAPTNFTSQTEYPASFRTDCERFVS